MGRLSLPAAASDRVQVPEGETAPASGWRWVPRGIPVAADPRPESRQFSGSAPLILVLGTGCRREVVGTVPLVWDRAEHLGRRPA